MTKYLIPSQISMSLPLLWSLLVSEVCSHPQHPCQKGRVLFHTHRTEGGTNKMFLVQRHEANCGETRSHTPSPSMGELSQKRFCYKNMGSCTALLSGNIRLDLIQFDNG